MALSLRPLPVLHAYDLASRKVERALELEQYADALAAANTLVASYPRESGAYSLRGYARVQLNDLQGAEADFEKAVDIDNDPWARDALAALRGQKQETGAR